MYSWRIFSLGAAVRAAPPAAAERRNALMTNCLCGTGVRASLACELRSLRPPSCAHRHPCDAELGGRSFREGCIPGSGWQNLAYRASVRTLRRRGYRFSWEMPFPTMIRRSQARRKGRRHASVGQFLLLPFFVLNFCQSGFDPLGMNHLKIAEGDVAGFSGRSGATGTIHASGADLGELRWCGHRRISCHIANTHDGTVANTASLPNPNQSIIIKTNQAAGSSRDRLTFLFRGSDCAR